MKIKMILGLSLLFTSFAVYTAPDLMISQEDGTFIRLNFKGNATVIGYQKNEYGSVEFVSRKANKMERLRALKVNNSLSGLKKKNISGKSSFRRRLESISKEEQQKTIKRLQQAG